jgi:hypothetical protein
MGKDQEKIAATPSLWSMEHMLQKVIGRSQVPWRSALQHKRSEPELIENTVHKSSMEEFRCAFDALYYRLGNQEAISLRFKYQNSWHSCNKFENKIRKL